MYSTVILSTEERKHIRIEALSNVDCQTCSKCQEALINAGADVNCACSGGCTVNLFGLENHYEKCAPVSVEAGSDVNPVTMDGRTPLIFAVHDGPVKLTDMLR